MGPFILMYSYTRRNEVRHCEIIAVDCTDKNKTKEYKTYSLFLLYFTEKQFYIVSV